MYSHLLDPIMRNFDEILVFDQSNCQTYINSKKNLYYHIHVL